MLEGAWPHYDALISDRNRLPCLEFPCSKGRGPITTEVPAHLSIHAHFPFPCSKGRGPITTSLGISRTNGTYFVSMLEGAWPHYDSSVFGPYFTLSFLFPCSKGRGPITTRTPPRPDPQEWFVSMLEGAWPHYDRKAKQKKENPRPSFHARRGVAPLRLVRP